MGYSELKTAYIKSRVKKYDDKLWQDMRIEAAHAGKTVTEWLIDNIRLAVFQSRKQREKLNRTSMANE